MRWLLGSNSQFQVYLGGSGQVYNPPNTPSNGNLFNSVYLRVDRGTDASTRIYTASNYSLGPTNARLPFTQVSQTAVSGSGTSGSPWQVTTVLQPSDATDNGITVTIVDRYTRPDSWITRRVTLSGMPASGAAIKFYQHVDTYLQNGDEGPGFSRTSDWNGSGIPDVVGVIKGAQFEALWYEPSSGTPHWDRYSSEGFINSIFQMCRGTSVLSNDPCVSGTGDLSNTINPSTTQDHGMAAQWSIPAGASTFTVEYRITFSLNPVELTKAFSPTTISSGGISTLTFNLTNRTTNPVATINFTDTLPAAVRIAATPNIRTSCPSGASLGSGMPGGMSVTAAAGSGTIQVTGASVSGAPIGSTRTCQIAVDVTSSTVGQHHNSSVNISGISNLLNLVGDQVLTVVAQSNFGTCDARMFLDQVDTSSNPDQSTLYRVGYAAAPFTFTNLGSGLARSGIGYNPQDNFIYGIEWDGGSGNELIRVGSNGSSANLGAITGLPVANYNNGVIAPNGDYYLMSGAGGTTLYRINLGTRTAATVTLSQSIQVSDLAWRGGLLWGISGGRLVSINPGSGAVVDVGSTSPLNSAVSMWGFTNALLASSGGSIYALDPANGAAALVSTAPASSNADGANCPNAAITFPADLSVTKTNTPAQGVNDLASDSYVPGEVRAYTIVVTNAGPFGAQNVTVSDPIPANIVAGTVSWTCSASSGGAVCGAASGSGALNSTGLDLSPGAVATYVVTMTVPANFTGALTNTVTVTPPTNVNDTNPANNTATDTDTAAARVTVSKLSLGGVGAFTFTGNNGIAPQTLTTTVAGTAVSGAAQVLTAPAAVTTITEGTPPAGYVLSAIACTGLPGGTATPDLATRTVTLDAAATAAGANIVCTFTNSRIPLLRLQKALPNGRAVASDQFTLNMTGMAGLTTTGAGNVATGVLTHSGITIGNSYTLSETGAGATNLAIYNASYACTNALAGGQTPSGTGNSFVVTPVAGDDLTCTLSNALLLADLQIVKTANPSGAVRVGQVVTYTLSASNNGPAAAHGARINDTPVGMDCQTPSATASCTAAGGASCPSATVPVSTLTGSGIILPLFPNGGSVTLTLQCKILP